METVAKANCAILADLLADYGMKNVVLSPGSRNAPISLAITRKNSFDCRVITDERVAGFVALGMAKYTMEPVAVVCTSGTAVLNIAPAVAEAYYARVPLIVVSADRPARWIDQRDSQTLRQSGILANVVRDSVDVPDTADAHYANLLINRALQKAAGAIPGPVHINMPLDRPLTALCRRSDLPPARRIECIRALRPDDAALLELCADLTDTPRVMVLAGSNRHLSVTPAFPKLDNIVFFADVNANLTGIEYWSPTQFDGVTFSDEFTPDVIVSLGGAVISDHFKGFLRRSKARVVNIGFDDIPVDTFGLLAVTVEMEPEEFLNFWARHIHLLKKPAFSEYRYLWNEAVRPTEVDVWCDYEAIRLLNERISPTDCLFLANGMTARYAQMFDWHTATVLDQRGVSGIEGCTSTAIGVSYAAAGRTLLITGDMGASYDTGALAAGDIGPNFKMLVLDNGGGDIFRHVATTATLPEREKLFAAPPVFPLEQLAAAYGFAYFKADSMESAPSAMDAFMAETSRPAILHCITEPERNLKAFDTIFKPLKV